MSGKDQFENILKDALEKGASDIHLKVGVMPVIRKFGKLRPLSTSSKPLNGHEVNDMAFSILDETQKEIFRQEKQIDLGYGVSGLGRFRINIFRQRGSTRMVIRAIAMEVPQIRELNLPPTIRKIAEGERGLILVTGITGSGKSTTLASMLDHINRNSNKHIITIEDPIEYLIRDRKSIISQREIGSDSKSFNDALRAALRQDPDVILIGEMRDRETIEIALTAAETGHLVMSTLHTADARESINRILSVFPPHQHSQVRYQMASVMSAVISQRLAQNSNGKGFIPAVEILVNTPRVAEMIEDPARTSDLIKAIEEGESSGMQSFDHCLMQLVKTGKISLEEAVRHSTSPEDFRLKHSGVSSGDDKKKWSDAAMGEGTNYRESWNHIQDLELETVHYKTDEESDDDEGVYEEEKEAGQDDGKIKIKKGFLKRLTK